MSNKTSKAAWNWFLKRNKIQTLVLPRVILSQWQFHKDLSMTVWSLAVWRTLREGLQKRWRLLLCDDLVLEGMNGERGDREREREMENSGIDAEENVTKQWNPSEGIDVFLYVCVWCLCSNECVTVYCGAVDVRSSPPFFHGGIFRAFSDLRQLKKKGVVMNADSGGCRQGVRWWDDGGMTDTNKEGWEERRGVELVNKGGSHLGRDN